MKDKVTNILSSDRDTREVICDVFGIETEIETESDIFSSEDETNHSMCQNDHSVIFSLKNYQNIEKISR